jgi:hypothetical protein
MTHDATHSVVADTLATAEHRRLQEAASRAVHWTRWGPYLSERQWGTVREDYSAHGGSWDDVPHDQARSRAYRWGEDGLLGITDRQCRLCFALALWNGQDPILKERLFGLTGPQGNHGEDVKELYFYLDSTPTHSYMKALYKYPQAAFPYAWLEEENRRRGKDAPECELLDTGVFREDRAFDVVVEYAKAAADDLLIRLTIVNRGPDGAALHLLPTVWFRNTWSWGRSGEGYWPRPRLSRVDASTVLAEHASLGTYRFAAEPLGAQAPPWLFTDNDTNARRLFGVGNPNAHVKDAFHDYVVHGRADAVNPAGVGTKAAAHYQVRVPAGGQTVVRLRLWADAQRPTEPFGPGFDRVIAQRLEEADQFYAALLPAALSDEERRVGRQASAGLLWTKQFFHYSVKDWLAGDPAQPAPPASRRSGRNHDWPHLYNRDVLSVPDKWEYPWYAAWDLAFHMIPFARLDPSFTKDQLVLLLREWYMHPNGQLPAYEFAFSDVNPPVHAWACWRVYKMTGPKGARDRLFLSRVFQKLLINFTWWVNRKDLEGKHLFAGGFLGLDNIGVFDRSKPLPTGGHLEQADGTAWMAFYCSTMLAMALELARENPAYEDVASKFFEHFVAIVDAMNTLGGTGLWDEQDGFYYDQLHANGAQLPLRIRSLVGIIPLFAVEVLEEDTLRALPGFAKRMRWFLDNRQDLARHISYMAADHHEEAPAASGAPPGQEPGGGPCSEGKPEVSPSDLPASRCSAQAGARLRLAAGDGGRAHHTPSAVPLGEVTLAGGGHRLLAIPSRERLERVLRYLLDEREFLSPYGIRSLSRVHRERPYIFRVGQEEYRVAYTPGESDTGLFGGNSNWRGPIWFPVNYLLIEALERYHHFYGDGLQVECPTGSGRLMSLQEVAQELAGRLATLFLPDAQGRRPCHGDEPRYAEDPHWQGLVLFHEYFHGDSGRGVGASHQTGWTALILRCLEMLAQARQHPASGRARPPAVGRSPAVAGDGAARRRPAAVAEADGASS